MPIQPAIVSILFPARWAGSVTYQSPWRPRNHSPGGACAWAAFKMEVFTLAMGVGSWVRRVACSGGRIIAPRLVYFEGARCVERQRSVWMEKRVGKRFDGICLGPPGACYIGCVATVLVPAREPAACRLQLGDLTRLPIYPSIHPYPSSRGAEWATGAGPSSPHRRP